MVERGENKYSKESSYSCKKYEIAKEWRGNDLSAEDISACFHILRGTRENLFLLSGGINGGGREEREREGQNLLDSGAVTLHIRKHFEKLIQQRGEFPRVS